ncbi:hypothetical protein [uncultured Microbacterium sp.]|uniref:hypothetical protein n=1 Tax=uncultured Microbacterium sp. TaxID=191216 RepID=UPI002620B603|nr:hypothetical protein [uncultured Microbacterium sp.]
MSEQRGGLRPLAVAFLVLGGIGLLGFVSIVIVSRMNTTIPLGWTLGIGTVCSALMFGSPLLAGYVPDQPTVGYVDQTDRESASTIPEFLPGEYTRSRVRRVVVVTVLWLTFSLWTLLYAVPITLLLVATFQNPDGELDPTPYVASVTWATLFLAAYVVLRVFLPQLTSRSAHLRALKDAVGDARVFPNRTSASLSRMVRSIAPDVHARIDGTSYVVVSGDLLAVWFPTRGRLVSSVQVRLSTIKAVEYSVINVALIGLKGIAITTQSLNGPLELCPVEHVVDFGRSSAHLARLLPASA